MYYLNHFLMAARVRLKLKTEKWKSFVLRCASCNTTNSCLDLWSEYQESLQILKSKVKIFSEYLNFIQTLFPKTYPWEYVSKYLVVVLSLFWRVLLGFGSRDLCFLLFVGIFLCLPFCENSALLLWGFSDMLCRFYGHDVVKTFETLSPSRISLSFLA